MDALEWLGAGVSRGAGRTRFDTRGSNRSLSQFEPFRQRPSDTTYDTSNQH